MKPNLLTSCVASMFSLLIASSAFSQNAYITNRNDSSISVINTQTNTVIATIPTHKYPSGVIVNHDGTRAYISYYTTNNANAVTVINTATNQIIGELPLNTGATFGGIIDVSPDGSTLYVGCQDTVVVVDAVTLTIKTKIPTEVGNSIQGIAISPDGLHVYVNGYNKLIDISTVDNAVYNSISASGANFLQLAINYQNTKLYAADKLNGNLNIFDLKSRTVKALGLGSSTTDCVCVNPDGTRVYATNYHDSTVCIVDGRADTLIKKIKLQAQHPYGVAITPDGTKVYVACFVNGSVAVINTSTNEVMTYVKVGFNPVAIGRFIGSNGVLPVTLMHFTALQLNKTIQLQWQAANETNTAGYIIERSTDGIHYTAIGNVTASTNSSHTYQYNDLNALGLADAKTVYYRLHITDKNGNATTSSVVSFMLKENLTILLLLPNPVKNILTAKASNFEGKAVLSIVDMAGRKWYQQSHEITNGSSISINTSSLCKGVYILRFSTGNTITEQKFLKQ